MATDYFILFLVVLGIHLTPAFTPPTWPVIALYSLSLRMPMPLIVLNAALAATLGRYALAHATRLHQFPVQGCSIVLGRSSHGSIVL